jgi:uncharacterized integral membrane protein
MRREHVGPEGEDDPREREDQEHLRQLSRHRQARAGKLIVALAVLVILLVFVLSNAKSVPVSFVFFTRRPPLIWVMLACAILGGLIGFIVGRPGRAFRFHRDRDDERD